jgi:thymidine kinase
MADDLQDKQLICKDCKRKFTFTVKEQKDFGQKGWPDPVRCRYCRRQKKILVALNDGVNIADRVSFLEVCDKCGRSFYTTIKRKQGINLFCDDCWAEIKMSNPKARSWKKD